VDALVNRASVDAITLFTEDLGVTGAVASMWRRQLFGGAA
jgi:hypothetical protein